MSFRAGLRLASMSEMPALRIGNQTSFSTSPLKPFEFAVSKGFDAFEWFPDMRESSGWALKDLDAETRLYIRNTARERNISQSVHAPLQANPLEPRSEGVLFETFDFARAIGASLINIHLITHMGIESYARAVGPFIRLLNDAGIRVSIENTPLTGPHDFNRLFNLLVDLIGGKAEAGMCFDLGHANLFEGTRNDYLGYLGALGPHVPITHLHVHENFGDSDTHLTIFTGPSAERPEGVAELIGRLMARGFSGSMILEQWPEPPELLSEARNKLLDMLGRAEARRRPPVFGLFEKRFEGGDALLSFASKRFREAGLGAEFHAGRPEVLERLYEFNPGVFLPTVHLDRGVSLLDGNSVKLIVDFARRFRGRLYGLIIHDQTEIIDRKEEYLSAVKRVGSMLEEVDEGPFLFIEYAVFIRPESYIELFDKISEVRSVSACVDTGHLGLWKVRKEFRRLTDMDVFDIKWSPQPQKLIEALDSAVGSALPFLLEVIRSLGRYIDGKPVHFHLHDGHPLSTFSDAGVSDHVSFLEKIPAPVGHKGRRTPKPRSLGLMYGPSGLKMIVREALKTFPDASFTLEIHPDGRRLPLGSEEGLLIKSADRAGAEMTNRWLSVIVENGNLLLGCLPKGSRTL